MTKITSKNLAQVWHDAVEAKDVDKILDMFSESIVVLTPFREEEVRGKEAVLKTFAAFVEVTEYFKYGRDWAFENEVFLEFTARVNGKHFLGIDLITLDEDGKIARFDIVARPLASIQALSDAVDAFEKAQAS